VDDILIRLLRVGVPFVVGAIFGIIIMSAERKDPYRPVALLVPGLIFLAALAILMLMR